MDQRSWDGRFIGWVKNPRDQLLESLFPNFEMLDAKIASALNKIIHSTRFKKKVSLEEQKVQKEDRFRRGKQTAFMIYDYFRVSDAHDTVFDYSDHSPLLFITIIFRNSILDERIFWFMSKIPFDDILESLYKLRIRESVQHQTVLELYDMEIHEKISMPNYQRLKTMVKRSICQKLRLRNFDDVRHGRIDTWAGG